VGRNVAEALARLAARPTLVSAVGADRQGQSILAGCPALHTDLVRVHPTAPTATYTAVIDRQEDLWKKLNT
jgi:sugar/nucleoside kinase (ribokinase family)